MPRRQANAMRAECLIQYRQGLRADHRGLRGTPTETPCEGPAYFGAPSSQAPWYTITHTPPATDNTTWTLWKNPLHRVAHMLLCVFCKLDPLLLFLSTPCVSTASTVDPSRNPHE